MLVLCFTCVSLITRIVISVLSYKYHFKDHMKYCLQQMNQIEQDLLDLKILSLLEPPSSYPPTQSQLVLCLQNKFEKECYRFLENQKQLHSCSKKIQTRLESALVGAQQVIQHMTKSTQILNKLGRDLKKIKINEKDHSQHEHHLKKICDLIKMQGVKDTLLKDGIINQEQYLIALDKIDNVVVELREWDIDAPIILQLRQQLSCVLEDAINRLIKNSNQNSLIKKIIRQHSTPFLRDEKITLAFTQSLKNSKINQFRITLNPLINNINYASNVVDLYETIINKWLSIIEEELEIFGEGVNQKIQNVLTSAIVVTVGELMPKLQRNFYKVKDIVGITKIRYYLSKFKTFLSQKWENDFDPLPKMLVKMYAHVEEKLLEEAQALQLAKYNIHTLTSYLPIREHLQSIKICRQYDIPHNKIDWQKAYSKLADSREPFKQPKNKSLLIFNLNIWYIYMKVMKDGEQMSKGEKIVNWCQETFVNINIDATKSAYEGKSIIKLIQICLNIAEVKKILFSQVSLLGHQNLRAAVTDKINVKFIKEIYEPMLIAHEINKNLSSEEVQTLCKQNSINIDKYQKIADLHIHSAQTISKYLL